MGGLSTDELIGRMLSLALHYQHDERYYNCGSNPMQPLTYDPAGIGLYKLGIARDADPDLAALIKTVSGVLAKHQASPFCLTRENYARLQGLSTDLLGLVDSYRPLLESLSPNLFFQDPKTEPFSDFSSEQVVIRILALEACNRRCTHCEAAATPEVYLPSADEFAWWFERFPHEKQLYLTSGEPFFNPELSRIAAFLLDLDVFRLTFVTSGIDFANASEEASALYLARLPPDKKQKLLLRLSVSDFPRLGSDSPRRLQKSTLEFALRHGLDLAFLSFLHRQQLLEELFLPAVSDLVGESAAKTVRITGRFNSVYFDVSDKERALGRSPLSRKVPYASKIKPTDMCLAKAGQLSVSVSGDSMLPGCCSPVSNSIAFGSIGDPKGAIIERSLAFRAALRSERDKRPDGRFDCLDCVGLVAESGLMRGDWKRLQRIIGQKNLDLVHADVATRKLRATNSRI